MSNTEQELIFIEETHEYFLGEKKLKSVTQALHNQGLAPDYSNVPINVLNAKAKRGTHLHKEIEEFAYNGTLGFTKEFELFLEWLYDNDYQIVGCEVRVHDDNFAGSIDLILVNKKTNKICIADVKKNAQFHKSYVMWQTNIYRHLSLLKVDELKCIHFDNDSNLNVYDLPILIEETKELLDCELKGLKFKGLQLVGLDKEIARIEDLETYILSIKEEQKRVDKELKELKSVLLKAMEDRGIKSVKTSKLNITYKAGYYKNGGVDLDSLKKDESKYAEYLELTKDYQTKTKVAPTLLISKIEEKKEKKNE